MNYVYGRNVHLARLPLTPQHHQAWLLWCRERVDWRVEWRSVHFSDESNFCLYASDGRTRVWHRPGERHLAECIHPQHTGPTSGFMVWGGHQLQLLVRFCVSAGKMNSAHYIVQVVNPVLLPFLQQEGDVFSK